MKLNVARKPDPIFTEEGAKAVRVDAEVQLRRSVMACMLWENSFYESGKTIAERIADLVPQCRPEFVAACAYHARTAQKLRHVPLLLVREMCRHGEHKALVGRLLADVIQRPDEITEFLAIYWATNGGKKSLPAQVKRALSTAFLKFDEYALAKYNRDGQVKLRDAMFLAHANPNAPGQRRFTRAERKAGAAVDLNERERLYRRLVDGELVTPDTWEVALSGGADKRETFERLMAEKTLGALAFIRNLRNMHEAGVSKETVAGYASSVNVDRVLPFRFIAAARAVPDWVDFVEAMMLRCLSEVDRLDGKTVIVVDNSGSMNGSRVSARSDMDRSDAACALAILLREICSECVVIGYGTTAKVIPLYRGFALADAIKRGPCGGTDTGNAVRLAAAHGYDRIIVVTDEQSHTVVPLPLTSRAYFVNVSTARNGIGYGAWHHIDGWSEAIIDYIRESEATTN